MNPQTNEGLSGLLEWSGPVIHDRLRLVYQERIYDPLTVARMSRLHASVWRALLAGDMDAFESRRADLALQLTQVGLTLDHVADADTETMTELLEIVIARFRRSPRTSQGYHLALLQLASFLRPSQAA
jgi:hypothetical protein